MKKYLPLFLLVFSIYANAQIVESFALEDVFAHLAEETLVVLDIDNTLIEPRQQLGSDQWFGHALQAQMKQDCNFDEALKIVLPLWIKIQMKTDVRPCEPSTAHVVRRLQEQGIPVIGLTTRSASLAWRTIDQLESVGIHLHRTAPHGEDFKVADAAKVYEEPAHYVQGILFGSGGHKGELLLDFLGHAGYNPSKVIFVNDKEKYLVEVEQALEKRGDIAYTGLRYGVCDERVEAFDPLIAALQLKCMHGFLSDEHAAVLLSKEKASQQTKEGIAP